MTDLSDRVISVPDLSWGFDDKGPFVHLGHGKWKTKIFVDPCPGYAHDVALVEACLAKCDAIRPLPRPPPVYVLRHEGLGRSNAETHGDSDWDTKDENGNLVKMPWIVLFGKRIPLMPAMTRYLVAHEYGHAVEHFVAAKRYPKDGSTFDNRKDYGKIRGLKEDEANYGSLNWHVSPAEVFANDFRTMVCGVEMEFWPHPVPRPEDVPEVVAYWDEVMKMDLTPGKPPDPKP